MKNTLKIATVLSGGGGGPPTYTLTPSGLPDGALPSPWVGAAFAVSSGAIKNTPTEGSDLIANGTFDADTNWNKGVDWSIGSGVATKVAGASASQLTSTSSRPLHIWYKSTFDATRSAGSFEPSNTNNFGARITTDGSYSMDGLGTGSNAWGYSGTAGAAAGTIDNVTCKPLTLNTLVASVNSGYIDAIVKAAFTKGDRRVGGVIANLDSQSSPANFIIATVLVQSTVTYLVVYKVVAGTYTIIVNFTSITYSAGANVELRTRRNGANLLVQAYYNNLAVGTEQTVSDAGIVNNKLHGIFSTNNANSIGVVSVAPNP